MRVSFLKFLPFFLLFLCSCADEGYYKGEDKRNLFLATIAKGSECDGVYPGFPLAPLDKEISEFAVHACTLAIIQAECPFLEYPLICLEMFKVDIPNFGPKLIKDKIK